MFQKLSQQQTKNPGRVASGKRLTERNRLAREAKIQAALTNSTNSTNSINSTKDQSSSSNSNSGYLILGVGGLIVSALGLYYQREAIMKTLRRTPNTQTTAAHAPNESNTVREDVVSPPARVVAPKRKYGICEME